MGEPRQRTSHPCHPHLEVRRELGNLGVFLAGAAVLEAFVVFGLLAYLCLLAVPGPILQLLLGGLLALVGLVGGGGAGILYHLALRRSLVRLGAEARGWLW